ncbi:MAG: hypothetical protein WBQ03_07555, partial [Candidatus Sulfotelmatobacter sp.]
MSTIAKLLCCSLLLTGLETCLGQEISVRVLDAKTGRGIKNQEVWAQFYGASSNHPVPRVSVNTNVDGVALIPISTPAPSQLLLSLSQDPLWCSGYVRAAVEEIFTHGVTNRANKGPCMPRFSSVPDPKPRE